MDPYEKERITLRNYDKLCIFGLIALEWLVDKVWIINTGFSGRCHVHQCEVIHVFVPFAYHFVY